MSDNKLVKMFQFMSENKMKLKENLHIDLKCAICDNILINACQGLCGCSFCRNCVDKLIKSNKRFCPGNSKECKEEILNENSNIQIDHKANKRVSMLTVKCPEINCSHECELVNMEEHYRLCSSRITKCQFHEIGCDNLTGNCQQTFDHNRLLLDFMSNLKNEVAHLKLSKEEILRDAGAMEKGSTAKNQNSGPIYEELKFLKLENVQLRAEINELRQTLTAKSNSFESKIDNLKLNVKSDRESSNNELKQQNDAIWIELDRSKREVDEKLAQQMNKINDTISKNKLVATELRRQVKEIDSLPDRLLRQFSDNASISAKKRVPLLVWDVDNLSTKRSAGTSTTSGFFSAVGTIYKMQLALYANGYGEAEGTSLTVYLYVWTDNQLRWPFRGAVTIAIGNHYTPTATKSLSKYCQIDKPLLYSWSPPFSFKYDVLSAEGLLKADSIVIECFIEKE